MQHYNDIDFLEIGTSNFDTLIEKATDNTIGFSVEPVKFYLDSLPSPKHVKKINAAISISNSNNDINLYYIPYDIIQKHKLPRWFKGCNRLDSVHPKVIEFKLEHLVETLLVKQIPISNFLQEQKIRKIELLKIDTEGGDTYILEHLYNYLINKDKEYYPKKIRFESNRLTLNERIEFIINLYSNLGYTSRRLKNDTEMILA